MANIIALPIVLPIIVPLGKPSVVAGETPRIVTVIVMPAIPNLFALASPVLLSVLIAEPANLLTLVPAGGLGVEPAKLVPVIHDLDISPW
jgi:hypothetical protein